MITSRPTKGLIIVEGLKGRSSSIATIIVSPPRVSDSTLELVIKGLLGLII